MAAVGLERGPTPWRAAAHESVVRVAGLVPGSGFRVVIPVFDKTLPTVAACLDATFRTLGGVPTYCLTDNEKTVTVEHVARIAVRNPELVPIARHYGTVVRSCMPADPASKGGTESTVRIGQMWGEVVEHDRDTGLGRVEAAQVAAELQEPRAVLLRFGVAVKLVPGQVVGGEQVPDPVRAGVGCPPPGAGFAVGVLVPAAAFGPLPSGVGLEVERAELVQTEDDFGFAVLEYDLGIRDRGDARPAAFLAA